MPFQIIRNDITQLKTDAIVNAANSSLKMGGGVCGAIFKAAGAWKLGAECRKIGHCDVGDAVITSGYKLPAKHIIHTVGPVWNGGDHGERELLYSCYKSSLELAQKHGCESIAFPLISSGVFGYPKDQALQVAISAIGSFLLQHDMTVYLVVFDKSAFSLSEKLFADVQEYIDDNYVEAHPELRSRRLETPQIQESRDFDEATVILDAEDFSPAQLPPNDMAKQSVSTPTAQPRSLDDVLSRMEETFSQALLRIIDEKGCKDSDVYKRANIDRRVFSKIRSNKDYRPSKNTALAFAIALELSLDDTRDLLMRAGYALSHSNKLDVIVEYFIGQQNYNIFEINEALFAFDQSLLGA